MEVKIFRIEGRIKKPNYVTPFLKDVRALKVEDAIEKVYADLGSQHRVKRYYLKITSMKEIPLEETKNVILHELSGES